MSGGWIKSSYSNPSGNCVEIQVVTAAPDDGLGHLRESCPGWTFWRGTHTGSFWAMPPGGGSLISAETIEDLKARISA